MPTVTLSPATVDATSGLAGRMGTKKGTNGGKEDTKKKKEEDKIGINIVSH